MKSLAGERHQQQRAHCWGKEDGYFGGLLDAKINGEPLLSCKTG